MDRKTLCSALALIALGLHPRGALPAMDARAIVKRVNDRDDGRDALRQGGNVFDGGRRVFREAKPDPGLQIFLAASENLHVSPNPPPSTARVSFLAAGRRARTTISCPLPA